MELRWWCDLTGRLIKLEVQPKDDNGSEETHCRVDDEDHLETSDNTRTRTHPTVLFYPPQAMELIE